MDKTRKIRLISIIGLCVMVMGLSIGFSAFTRNLNIIFSESNVKVSGDLDVKFLTSNNLDDTSVILNGYTESMQGIDYGDIIMNSAKILSDGVTISGMGGTFSGNDQVIFYTLYVYNNSEYDAYLKAVDFLNYIGYNTNKVCVALEGTNQSLVDEACKDIHVAVLFDTEIVIDTDKSDFISVKVSKVEIVEVSLLIVYAGEILNENTFGAINTSLLPNGDFKVNFGDIKFSFSSLEG